MAQKSTGTAGHLVRASNGSAGRYRWCKSVQYAGTTAAGGAILYRRFRSVQVALANIHGAGQCVYRPVQLVQVSSVGAG
jgi:hypothetical protein